MAVAKVVASALPAANALRDSVARTLAMELAALQGKSATARIVAPPPAMARTVATTAVEATAESATPVVSASMDCAVRFRVRVDVVPRGKFALSRIVASPNVTERTAAMTVVVELAGSVLRPTSASLGVAVPTPVSGFAAMGMRFAQGRTAAHPIVGDWNAAMMAAEESVGNATRHSSASKDYAAPILVVVIVAKMGRSAILMPAASPTASRRSAAATFAGDHAANVTHPKLVSTVFVAPIHAAASAAQMPQCATLASAARQTAPEKNVARTVAAVAVGSVLGLAFRKVPCGNAVKLPILPAQVSVANQAPSVSGKSAVRQAA